MFSKNKRTQMFSKNKGQVENVGSQGTLSDIFEKTEDFELADNYYHVGYTVDDDINIIGEVSKYGDDEDNDITIYEYSNGYNNKNIDNNSDNSNGEVIHVTGTMNSNDVTPGDVTYLNRSVKRKRYDHEVGGEDDVGYHHHTHNIIDLTGSGNNDNDDNNGNGDDNINNTNNNPEVTCTACPNVSRKYYSAGTKGKEINSDTSRWLCVICDTINVPVSLKLYDKLKNKDDSRYIALIQEGNRDFSNILSFMKDIVKREKTLHNLRCKGSNKELLLKGCSTVKDVNLWTKVSDVSQTSPDIVYIYILAYMLPGNLLFHNRIEEEGIDVDTMWKKMKNIGDELKLKDTCYRVRFITAPFSVIGVKLKNCIQSENSSSPKSYYSPTVIERENVYDLQMDILNIINELETADSLSSLARFVDGTTRERQ